MMNKVIKNTVFEVLDALALILWPKKQSQLLMAGQLRRVSSSLLPFRNLRENTTKRSVAKPVCSFVDWLEYACWWCNTNTCRHVRMKWNPKEMQWLECLNLINLIRISSSDSLFITLSVTQKKNQSLSDSIPRVLLPQSYHIQSCGMMSN